MHPRCLREGARRAAMPSWAGFYLGVHGGYGWGRRTSSPIADVRRLRSVSICRAETAGRRLRRPRRLQLAVRSRRGRLRTRFQRHRHRRATHSTSYAGAADACTDRSDRQDRRYLGSIRARLGWLPIDNVLLYGTAGLGWERLDTNTGYRQRRPGRHEQLIDSDTASNRFGWVAGAGVEAKLPGSNWIGRLEYLHYGFGADCSLRPDTIAEHLRVVGCRRPSSRHRARRPVLQVRRPGGAAPVRYAKAPPISPAVSWAGFYLGAHGGYGWKDDDFTQVVNFSDLAQAGGIKSRGWVAGGHAGYNWQYGRVVTGLEVDFSLGDLKGDPRRVGARLWAVRQPHARGPGEVSRARRARASAGCPPTPCCSTRPAALHGSGWSEQHDGLSAQAGIVR